MDLHDPALDGCVLREQSFGIVVNTSHPLAQNDSVVLDELINDGFAAFPPGTAQRHVLTELFKKKGLSPKVVFESDNHNDIMRAVSRGHCVAGAAKIVFQNYNHKNTVFLEITDPVINVNLRLYWLKTQNGNEKRPIAKIVREVIREYFMRKEAQEKK